MKQFPYTIIGVLLVTILVNMRICNAHDLLVQAPYMQTPTACVVDAVHYARSVCDDVVLRVDKYCSVQAYRTMVDMCIASMMSVLSDVFIYKRIEHIQFIQDDALYIEAIIHSMIADLQETHISSSQSKALVFIAALSKALLVNASKIV